MIVAGFIGRWRLYKKLGYKGWVSLIPLYSTYCLIEALFGNGLFMLLPFGAYFAALVLSVVFGMISEVLMVFPFIIYMGVMLWYTISISTRLAHAFGKSGLWTLGTVLFFGVMLVVYGLSDMRYRNRYYPYMDTYDAIDGFIDFFRDQRYNHENEMTNSPGQGYCKNCGAPLKGDTAFCSECGARLD